jgi:hypothetical protein
MVITLLMVAGIYQKNFQRKFMRDFVLRTVLPFKLDLLELINNLQDFYELTELCLENLI